MESEKTTTTTTTTTIKALTERGKTAFYLNEVIEMRKDAVLLPRLVKMMVMMMGMMMGTVMTTTIIDDAQSVVKLAVDSFWEFFCTSAVFASNYPLQLLSQTELCC